MTDDFRPFNIEETLMIQHTVHYRTLYTLATWLKGDLRV